MKVDRNSTTVFEEISFPSIENLRKFGLRMMAKTFDKNSAFLGKILLTSSLGRLCWHKKKVKSPCLWTSTTRTHWQWVDGQLL